MDDFRQVTGLDQATGDDTLRLARSAAEAIRGLNWLTRHETGLGQPSIAYDTIGALAQAASRLGQLLTQITRWLDQALAAGQLGHDLGEDPAAATGAAEEDPGGIDGRGGVLAEVVAEPPGCQRPVEPAGDLGERQRQAGGGQGQGADDVVGRGRLAQPGLAAGEPVQAADRLSGGAGQQQRVVAGDLAEVDDLPEVIHGRPPRLL